MSKEPKRCAVYKVCPKCGHADPGYQTCHMCGADVSEEIAGGLLVKRWDGFFLRKDTFNEYERYSLFQLEPYGRVGIYSGSLHWAIIESESKIKLLNQGD